MILRGFGLVMAVVFSIAAAAVIGYAIQWYTAAPVGKLQARQQIQSGDFRIQAYDHFFNLCAQVQTDEQTLDASRQELKGADDKQNRQRIQTNITGIISARAEAVNQYNADAAKSYTQGQFRSSQLPYRLPIQVPEGGTACTA